MGIIDAEKLSFSYSTQQDGSSLEAISFTIEWGELAVFLGGSGAGKSTLARLMDALLPVKQGQLHINGMDCGDESKVWEIRRRIGIIFENFDDQFISSYAREELGFAARNFGVDESEIEQRINKALELVDMGGYADSAPQLLPLNMRQRLMIAASIVHDPDIVIFDEPFSALDESSADRVQKLIMKLHDEGKTIILMTKDAERAMMAEKLYLLYDGRLLAQGSPQELFSDRNLMDTAKMRLPFTVQVYHDLLDAGVKLEKCPMSIDELVEEVCL